jgi:hypothetical protein
VFVILELIYFSYCGTRTTNFLFTFVQFGSYIALFPPVLVLEIFIYFFRLYFFLLNDLSLCYNVSSPKSCCFVIVSRIVDTVKLVIYNSC